MKLLLILLTSITFIVISILYYQSTLLTSLLSMFGIFVFVLFLDVLIIKLPESNEIRKWWRKNVVESTP